MIIDYLDDSGDLYRVSFLLKDQSVWLNQVDCILVISVLVKRMTSSNLKLNHQFDCIGCADFIDSLMNFIGHLVAMSFDRNRSIGTHLLNAFIRVFDFQRITTPSRFTS